MSRVESSQVFSENENYAVIVGIDQYDHTGALNYAVKNAELLSNIFKEQGYHVTPMANWETTLERI